jgi:phosphoribosylformimino-5-aminoimidazole carboxamide ribotide isomerase
VLLIPAIDLAAGRCVRLRQGDFAQETRYRLTPHELLGRYEALGAGWVHIVDLDGARSGERANQAIIEGLASSSPLRLQVGGGARSQAAVEALLAAGVARVVIGSAAVLRPADVLQWLQRFGSERLCLAFDVRVAPSGEPRVHTHGWAQSGRVSLWDALAPYGAHLKHVLCTDIARDGMLSSPNLELYSQALARFAHLHWQASGGVSSAADLGALARIGLTSAISGKALLEERMHSQELRPVLPAASFPASTSATAQS